MLKVAAQFVCDPRASIPRMFENRSQARAMYRLMSNDAVDHASVLAGPVEATVKQCRAESRVLVVQDTTHVSFGGLRDESGLGPVDSTGGSRGFLVHSALALTSLRRPLGVLGQEVWARPQKARSRTETPAQRKQRPRESEKWSKVALQVEAALGGLGTQRPSLVEIFDAEGDAFEVLEILARLGHGFVIRAARNRLLETDEPEANYLAEAAAQAPPRGRSSLEIPARPGRAKRVAKLELRSTRVTLQPPRSRYRTGDSLEVGVVHVVELQPPEGVEPIGWLLLTSEPIESMEDCISVLADYTARWMIEEFHMALKTGCSLEERQLQSFDSLSVLLAICTPVAVTMLALRHAARVDADAPSSTVLTETQLRALRALRPKLPAKLTVRDATRAIAEIGGFLGRKSDGEPGWRTLWLGFRDVLLVERAMSTPHESG